MALVFLAVAFFAGAFLAGALASAASTSGAEHLPATRESARYLVVAATTTMDARDKITGMFTAPTTAVAVAVAKPEVPVSLSTSLTASSRVVSLFLILP
ncbi:MAG: hypothetical protein D6E12_15875 [Desulfovibrio sp.]|nr:MAG: hypothetical protein D6E12_15875 [Desulfovibrio sp.]